jgi:hypothetical protein
MILACVHETEAQDRPEKYVWQDGQQNK